MVWSPVRPGFWGDGEEDEEEELWIIKPSPGPSGARSLCAVCHTRQGLAGRGRWRLLINARGFINTKMPCFHCGCFGSSPPLDWIQI